ncbi:hypothetical protein Y032_0014g2233 [Ancylostoma ceylanicum]|uniref:Histone deacetylase domain-containing protein n=1 Tax=Ancylostoma ceylanicum TaxID=53326 RepID=A0A016VAA6_9BILA|nr:hypothetical protein Y032_0014g2233 [Ancylostoma ceylanicum]
MFFISDRSMLDHRCPWDTYHIEVSERLATILRVSEEPEISKSLQHLKPRSATEEEIEMIHTKRYISEIKRTRELKEEKLEEFSSNYEDIYVNEHTFDAALLAAGCVFELVDAVSRTGTPGFAAVRPPGHHAFPDQGCGFCIFNNVALAAKYALRKGHSRVLIVDWDVHAGQGTQECISDDDRIRLVSIHRFERGHFWPNLQQSAVKTKFKNTINVPLNDIGMSDSDYLAIFQLVVHPIINDFKPDIILVSCGFDAALGDPEGEMRLTPAGYATLTRQLLTWRIPLVMVLEGGYFLDSIALDFKWVAKALLGHEIPPVSLEPLNAALPPVFNRIHAEYGAVYPTLAMIRELKRRLNPCDEEEEKIEYDGTREFSLPYPTRGLYAEREQHVIAAFKKELHKIVDGYDQHGTYKTVEYVLQEDHPLSCAVDGNSVTLRVSKGTRAAVDLLISRSINPLLQSNNFEAQLNEADIEKLVELLRQIQTSTEIPRPYILYL